MSQKILSLRMHASRQGEHVSGGERLLTFEDLGDAALALLHRALEHPRGCAEKISLTVENLSASKVRRAELLPVTTHQAANWRQGRNIARKLLVTQGVATEIVENSIRQLANGPGTDGRVMRGAMLVDAGSGERLEPDGQRGVRVSRMDLDNDLLAEVAAYLNARELNSRRVIEALVLASKVTLYPEVIAELCWSDDPDYLTGYVASAAGGYQRITRMKPRGDMFGGRIIFVCPGTEPSGLIERLQHEAVLFGPLQSGGPR